MDGVADICGNLFPMDSRVAGEGQPVVAVPAAEFTEIILGYEQERHGFSDGDGKGQAAGNRFCA